MLQTDVFLRACIVAKRTVTYANAVRKSEEQSSSKVRKHWDNHSIFLSHKSFQKILKSS